MIGLSEAEDCDSFDTAIYRINTIARQVEEVRKGFEEARDRNKKFHHAFSINFAVYSDNKVDDVAEKELRSAMARYFVQLGNGPPGDVKDACENIHDTYEQGG